MALSHDPSPASETSVPIAPLDRMVRIYTDPARAFVGLESRVQFWIPLLVMVVLASLVTGVLYQRAIVPMQLEQMESAVTEGRMPPEQFDRIAEMIAGPTGMAWGLGSVVIFSALYYLVSALVMLFGVGFVLGGRLRYRLALEVVCWSSLVTIPYSLIHGALAWMQESMEVRLSLGVLLPAMADASRLQLGLIALLEWLNPFSIWYLVLCIIGASAVTGVPRKNVAWVLVALHLAFGALIAAFAASAARPS